MDTPVLRSMTVADHSANTAPKTMGCVKDGSWGIVVFLVSASLLTLLPPLVVLCPALTHDSPVCFIPCLADGPEISPEQEEGAVPTSFFDSSFEPSLCLALLVALTLSV